MLFTHEYVYVGVIVVCFWIIVVSFTAFFFCIVYSFFLVLIFLFFFFFFSSRRRHTRYIGDWSSDVCSSDLSPIAKLCVASLIAPRRYGPTNPPVLPTEFTSAIDAAAAVFESADRDVVARAQNGPNIDANPIIAIDSVTIDQTMPVPAVLTASAAPPTVAATAKCQRRSPVRSECRPASTIATAPKAYGIALNIPTVKSLPSDARPEPCRRAALIICGSQKPSP